MFRESVIKILKEYLNANTTSPLLYGKINSKKDMTNHYEYSISILNADKQNDSQYPIIPNIKDAASYTVGDTVVIGIMYADISQIQIIKKVQL